MEIAKEVKRRYDELITIRDLTIQELKPLEAYLKTAGLLEVQAEEDKPKRTRRKKNASLSPEA